MKKLFALSIMSIFFVPLTAIAVELPSFSTPEKKLRIPQVTVDDQNILYDVELSLDFESGKFSLQKYSDALPNDIAELNLPFKLVMGQNAKISNTDLQIQFSDVTEDSRCPTPLNCIWSGQITIEIDITRPEKNLQKITLTSPNSYPVIHDLSEYKLELLAVQPYPISDKSINKQDYLIILRISPFTQ